jgi:hypothetical protein
MMESKKLCFMAILNLVVGMGVYTPVHADENSALAQELSNPVANLISVPIQMNFDNDIGVNDQGKKVTLNIQPVIPFEVNNDWNLITRTIIPLIDQDKIYPGAGSQSGFGDINLSLFFSPKKPTAGGIIWGVGTAILLPTATDDLLGADKWGIGPSVVALTVRGPWTIGGLATHIWSVAGNNDRSDISNTLIQPFVAYNWPSAWTASFQSESTYNWKTKKWSVPLNLSVSKLVRIGKLPVSLQAGIGYWLESPDTGPEGMRYRFAATLILPK